MFIVDCGGQTNLQPIFSFFHLDVKSTKIWKVANRQQFARPEIGI
jgi:hypothetical protein